MMAARYIPPLSQGKSVVPVATEEQQEPPASSHIKKSPTLWRAIFLAPVWALTFPVLTIGMPALVLGLAGHTDQLDWQSNWRDFSVFLVLSYLFGVKVAILYGMPCYEYLNRTQRLSQMSVLTFGVIGGLIYSTSLLAISERTEQFLIGPVIKLLEAIGQLRGAEIGAWDYPSDFELLAIQLFATFIIGLIGLLMASSTWKMIERHDH